MTSRSEVWFIWRVLSFCIKTPQSFGWYREAEFIPIYAEFELSDGEPCPDKILIEIGSRVIECDVVLGKRSNQIYSIGYKYRAGRGVKKINFFAVGPGKIKQRLGARYIFVRNEQIGPKVKIPKCSTGLGSGINLIGSLNYEFGLGEAARGSAKGIAHAGIRLNQVLAPMSRNCNKIEGFDIRLVARSLDYYINLLHLNAPDMILMRKRWPGIFRNGQYNIGYWFFELPRLPAAWSEGFAGLKEIWVASRFVFDAICAVSPIPVYIVPSVVEIDKPVDVSKGEFGLPEDKMCILSIFDLNSYRQRKNPEAAVEAFRLACERSANLHLVLKVNNSDRNQDSMSILRDCFQGIKNVTLFTEVFTRQNLTRLQAACDTFISLHRSEGFGLNLVECMALGKPVIATNWSANTDYMNGENSCPVDYKLVELTETIGPYEKGQVWAEPFITSAADWIIKLERDIALRERLGRQAQQTILEKYSLDAVAALISGRTKAIYDTRQM